MLHCYRIGLFLPTVVGLSEVGKLDEVSQWDSLVLWKFKDTEIVQMFI